MSSGKRWLWRAACFAAASSALLGTASAAQLSRAEQGSGSFVIRFDHWSDADERDYSQFVQLIGDSGCPTVDACLKGPWNPFHASDSPSARFYSDCAQFPYVLRAYFAWKRNLPFSYESGVSVRGSGDARYSKDGNIVTARTDVKTGSMSGPALLTEMQRAISTASYRMHPDIDSPLPPDLYSAALGPKSIRPGTMIYDPNGHAALVTRVDRDGRIAFIDSHPDNTVTHEFYDLRFVRSRPGQGAGFKNWRPVRLVGYHTGPDGALVGGHMELARNSEIADFSDEQYYGNGARPAGDDDWANSTFTLNGEQLDYYDYVRAKVGGGKLEFDPVKEVAEMVDSNCNDLHYRAQAVDIAIQAGIENRGEPDRLPRNIYGTSGDWESFSTPSRDARLKTAFKELRDKAERFVTMYERGDTRHLIYHGNDIVGDMLAAYDAGVAKCSVGYTRSSGASVALSYEDARKRLFLMSFDPYQCIERRWGASEQSELASCRDDGNKSAWYDAEQNLRNQIDRTYEARMDFSLDELRTPGAGKGVATPPDTDVRAYLVSMQGKVSPQMAVQPAPVAAMAQATPSAPGLIPTPVVAAPVDDPEADAARAQEQKKQQQAADLAEWRAARKAKFAEWHDKECAGRVASTAPLADASQACTSSSAPRAIGEIWDMPDAPVMMALPAGSFTMGSPGSEPGRKSNEGPQHHVDIPRPFAVSQTLVTFHEWDACVADGGCKGYSPMDARWGRGKQPVINVSVSDAEAYAAWLSAKTGHHYRLLSEAEWEYAARAGTDTPFWWGDTISTERANYDSVDFPASYSVAGKYIGMPTPVDKYAPNLFGLTDMAGNIWQWTADCWNENYSGHAPGNGEAWRSGDCNRRVVRGGAFNQVPAYERSAFRFWEVGDLRSSLVGFRVAREM
jgi:formylglycine-generating enzyme required for sulfatase activity